MTELYAQHQFRRQDFALTQFRSPREIEYDLFSQITSALKHADEAGRGPDAVDAIVRNNQLWSVLAADLADPENQLPEELRARLLSLAGFSIRHGNRILAGDPVTTAVLIEINISVMKGLRGEARP